MTDSDSDVLSQQESEGEYSDRTDTLSDEEFVNVDASMANSARLHEPSQPSAGHSVSFASSSELNSSDIVGCEGTPTSLTLNFDFARWAKSAPTVELAKELDMASIDEGFSEEEHWVDNGSREDSHTTAKNALRNAVKEETKHEYGEEVDEDDDEEDDDEDIDDEEHRTKEEREKTERKDKAICSTCCSVSQSHLVNAFCKYDGLYEYTGPLKCVIVTGTREHLNLTRKMFTGNVRGMPLIVFINRGAVCFSGNHSFMESIPDVGSKAILDAHASAQKADITTHDGIRLTAGQIYWIIKLAPNQVAHYQWDPTSDHVAKEYALLAKEHPWLNKIQRTCGSERGLPLFWSDVKFVRKLQMWEVFWQSYLKERNSVEWFGMIISLLVGYFVTVFSAQYVVSYLSSYFFHSPAPVKVSLGAPVDELAPSTVSIPTFNEAIEIIFGYYVMLASLVRQTSLYLASKALVRAQFFADASKKIAAEANDHAKLVAKYSQLLWHRYQEKISEHGLDAFNQLRNCAKARAN